MICVRVNSDVPPPIMWHVEHDGKAAPWREADKARSLGRTWSGGGEGLSGGLAELDYGCATSPPAHALHSTCCPLLQEKPGHGFAGSSADSLFHTLSGVHNPSPGVHARESAEEGSRSSGQPQRPQYSLVAFEFGRPPRYTIRAAQNAWFVRSDLLGLPAGRRLRLRTPPAD